MSPTITTLETFEELDHRSSNGIDVWLLWSRETGELTVVVEDETGERLTLAAAPDQAMQVFNHPYAYAAFRGLLAEEPEAIAA